MRGRRALALLGLGALLALGASARAGAQGNGNGIGAQQVRVDLIVTGAPLAWPAPTAADYNAGFVILPAPVQFTVDATKAPKQAVLLTTVRMRALSAVLGGNAKPVGDIEWSLGSPAGPWTPLGTGSTLVQQLTMSRNGANDTWGNWIYFRTRLSWTADVPATYSTPLELSLEVVVL